jgi:hypothetical protein
VCDVLVVRTLEVAGRRIVRGERSRYRIKGTRPDHIVHTLWPPNQDTVQRVLKGAWDVVPAMLDSWGCCGVTSVQVTHCLDSYTTDLLITGTPHTIDQLCYRFARDLGIVAPVPEPYRP